MRKQIAREQTLWYEELNKEIEKNRITHDKNR